LPRGCSVIIDIENEVFTKIATELRSQFTGINVYGEDVRSPSSFPCVSIVEADNYTVRRTQDSGSNENHANLMYEVNVYSNKTSGKKTECKEIFAVIDEIMLGLGFTRSNKNPVTMDEATIYRIVGRYVAIVSTNQTIYRR
jgi:hypothetical protein